MDLWPRLYRSIADHVTSLDAPIVYFRGHAETRWTLRCGLGRFVADHHVYDDDVQTLEQAMYYDFVTSAGDLIPRSNDGWDNIFTMQHHGLPTRLLDWTESFAVALFFALNGHGARPCIWVLDPFVLNNDTANVSALLDVDDLGIAYVDCFVRRSTQFNSDVVAVRPRKDVRRLAQQLSGFTLHRSLRDPLERLHPLAVKKFRIPKDAMRGAEEFLRLTGISEYSLFPDLDGLARHLKSALLTEWVSRST